MSWLSWQYIVLLVLNVSGLSLLDDRWRQHEQLMQTLQHWKMAGHQKRSGWVAHAYNCMDDQALQGLNQWVHTLWPHIRLSTLACSAAAMYLQGETDQIDQVIPVLENYVHQWPQTNQYRISVSYQESGFYQFEVKAKRKGKKR